MYLDFMLVNVICKKCFIVSNLNVFKDYDLEEHCYKCICETKFDNE